MKEETTGYVIECKNAGEVREFIDANGTIIEFEGEKFYYLPYWFEFVEGGIVIYHLNNLPSKLIMAIKIHREAKEDLGEVAPEWCLFPDSVT